MTKILPDDTWLTQFEVKTCRKARSRAARSLLRGESGNAGRLVLGARGFEAVRAGCAALADDQDPAGAGRSVRSWRPAEAVAAARIDSARERGASGFGASGYGAAPPHRRGRRRRRCDRATPAGAPRQRPRLQHRRAHRRQRRRRRGDPAPPETDAGTAPAARRPRRHAQSADAIRASLGIARPRRPPAAAGAAIRQDACCGR